MRRPTTPVAHRAPGRHTTTSCTPIMGIGHGGYHKPSSRWRPTRQDRSRATDLRDDVHRQFPVDQHPAGHAPAPSCSPWLRPVDALSLRELRRRAVGRTFPAARVTARDPSLSGSLTPRSISRSDREPLRYAAATISGSYRGVQRGPPGAFRTAADQPRCDPPSRPCSSPWPPLATCRTADRHLYLLSGRETRPSGRAVSSRPPGHPMSATTKTFVLAAPTPPLAARGRSSRAPRLRRSSVEHYPHRFA